LAPPMWHGTRLVGLIVPEGRIGRKGKSGPLFSSFFPFLPILCCSLMCAWICCSHPVKGVIKLSCCMQSLVLMLSCSVGESHASSLLGSAISELTLDHAALWLPKCWTSSRTVRRLLEMVI
jgi:hypothetical protein